MSSERCLVVLVLSAVISGVRLSDSTEGFTETTTPSEPDYAIDEFFNTTEEIWVFNTTQPNAQRCRKDLKLNMTSNTTFFKRSYKDNEEEKTDVLQGVFDYYYGTQKEVYDKMNVSGDSRRVYEEVLEYASENFTCGVVSVAAYENEEKFGTVFWRDLRVRKRPDNTTSIEENCKERYDEIVKLAKQNWTSPYDDKC
ncbi:uncharacterized protein [Dermacentor albipictus]|uniref:uncharacterized protein n=1 Tax=Dermacentor albipictus TaxID=60249 RepID=UPI0038FD315F